jgi:hypothetical protein
MSVDQLRADRFKYLSRLYDVTGGNLLKWPDMWEVGESIGFTRDYTDRITNDLQAAGLVNFPATGGSIQILHPGVQAVEDARATPDRPTKFFPPVNNIIINNGTMTGSAIVQGSHGTHQELHYNRQDAADLRAVLAEIKAAVDGLNLSPEDATDLKGDVATAEAQLSTSRPKKGVVRECLKSIGGYLKKAGGVVASGLAAKLVERIAG